MAWIGDQLTVDRLRKLFKFHAEDLNGFDWLDWLILVFRWLHIVMAFSNMLHKQYMGTVHGCGLSHAFNLLHKKGLATSLIQGPCYRDLNEIFYHMATAHAWEEWQIMARVDDLKELWTWSPSELLNFATAIYNEYVSNEALTMMDDLPDKDKDEVKHQTIMWNHDVLDFMILDQAIKNSDMGLMEDFLPYLLFWFIGSQRSNYTIEVLELMQGLHQEWPDEIWWVANFYNWQ